MGEAPPKEGGLYVLFGNYQYSVCFASNLLSAQITPFSLQVQGAQDVELFENILPPSSGDGGEINNAGGTAKKMSPSAYLTLMQERFNDGQLPRKEGEPGIYCINARLHSNLVYGQAVSMIDARLVLNSIMHILDKALSYPKNFGSDCLTTFYGPCVKDSHAVSSLHSDNGPDVIYEQVAQAVKTAGPYHRTPRLDPYKWRKCYISN